MGVVARARTVAGVAVVGTVVAGLGIRVVAEGDVAKYGGVALYAVLVYVLVVLAAPRVRPVVAGAVAFAFSCAVELVQLSGVTAGPAERSVIVRLVLGSTFNAPDLLWYAVGAALAASAHTWAVGRRAARERRPGAPRAAVGGRWRGP
ncbi:DUF2809 domain-containing protein [Streptomyces sp. NP-1717]|uniref:DUF2809 domain-containing protein n=1 Tax=Streptomyces sp. NP-1717 TaxID=2704470 RepID=UPI001F5C6A63|nr:DUF2809 domain-containing protein [Streptomyces sp. NP-1717]MCI3224200.1 DUF2809 domain-containing protein [Streptomyces sp. NP-1717]